MAPQRLEELWGSSSQGGANILIYLVLQYFKMSSFLIYPVFPVAFVNVRYTVLDGSSDIGYVIISSSQGGPNISIYLVLQYFKISSIL